MARKPDLIVYLPQGVTLEGHRNGTVSCHYPPNVHPAEVVWRWLTGEPGWAESWRADRPEWALARRWLGIHQIPPPHRYEVDDVICSRNGRVFHITVPASKLYPHQGTGLSLSVTHARSARSALRALRRTRLTAPACRRIASWLAASLAAARPLT